MSVRDAATAALGKQGANPIAAEAIVAMTRDSNARVRATAASALVSVRSPSASARARELATSDPSLIVQGNALRATAVLDSSSAFDVIRAALARDSWRDLSRTNAVRALAAIDAPETIPMIARYLADGTSRNTRVAAIEALVQRAKGHEAEIASSIVPLLDNDDLFVRSAAAAALGQVGQPSAVQALEARRRIEAESRVVNVIDAALARLAK